MARYIKDFQISVSQDMLFNKIYSYLMSEGYDYIEYDSESVFKKGKGIVNGPTFIKLSFGANSVRLEAWLKYALLPGVYVGEIGLKGFVGAAAKGPLKLRVAQIENMIMQSAADYAANSCAAVQNTNSVQCKNCGAMLAVNDEFCCKCGTKAEREKYSNVEFAPDQYLQILTPPEGENITKRQFRNMYVPGFKKEVRNVAIFCYVLAGLTAFALVNLLVGENSVSIAQAYQNDCWMFWVSGGCLFVCGLLTLMARKRKADALESDEG
ncbi:MAG: hypothetical protein IJZ90_00220, partial [Clostridia bacterium]|nr:hypothetical protein [Clostridia bacterium]